MLLETKAAGSEKWRWLAPRLWRDAAPHSET